MYFVGDDFEFDGDLLLYFVVDHLADDSFLRVHLDILNEVKP